MGTTPGRKSKFIAINLQEKLINSKAFHNTMINALQVPYSFG